MFQRTPQFALSTLFLATLAACGGGGSSTSSSNPTSPVTPPITTPQTLPVQMMLSDATSEDWATIGVKVLGLVLNKSDGTTVTVPLGATSVPLNLEQLDQLGQILGAVTLTAGDTYTGTTLTISANPGDVSLIVSNDPEAGFPVAAQTVIPGSQIQIQGAQGASGSKTVTVPVKFVTPYTVPANTTGTTPPAIDLEVDLNHPAFIVNHTANDGQTVWAVNFNGPLHHHPFNNLPAFVLRHLYGTVTSISSDNTSLSLTQDLPTMPIVSPETAVTTTNAKTILADATNGTLFYNLDSKTSSTIKDFSSVSSVLAAGEFVRVAARYQADGSLIATRVWASSNFNTVFVSPEGHVLHVNNAKNQFVVADETGKPVTMTVNANTQFFFRQPANALADATPVGTGTAFLANGLMRGFKVHVQAVDPLATPMVAQTVDIETAAFDGTITSPSATGFTYTRKFNTASDDYSLALNYISSASPNGNDPANGNAITGFKYWYFAYPTVVTSGSSAITSFTNATSGAINFGGSVGQYWAHGATYAHWGDAAATPAVTSGWVAPWTVIEPTTLPRGTVATALASNAFTVTATGGTNPVTVNINTTSGSATLVYQVSRANDVVTVTPQDITTTTGLANLTSGLAVGAPVVISAVPTTSGQLNAYVLTYYTGDLPK